MPRSTVIVVTTTNASGLRSCLAALTELPPHDQDFEVVVVLNGADDEVREVAARAPGVATVDSEVNRGFAGGCNLGRDSASGEFVVILHDDARPRPGWLSALTRCADQHPEAGAVGSRVLDPDGSLQLAGAIVWRDGSTRALRAADGDFPDRRAVDYCGSSSLLVRAATWDAVGGMDDELYPAYFVDADLAMAIRSRGESVLYEPASTVVHDRGASSGPRLRSFLYARNRERFRAKWAHLLARHAPPGDIERALARTAAEARTARPAPRGPAAPRPPADPRRFLRMDREIKDTLIEQLTAEVEALHATIRRKDSDLVKQEAALHQLHAELSRRAGPS